MRHTSMRLSCQQPAALTAPQCRLFARCGAVKHSFTALSTASDAQPAPEQYDAQQAALVVGQQSCAGSSKSSSARNSSSSSSSNSPPGRRGILNMLGAAAAAALLSGLSADPAAAAAAAVNGSSALEEYMKLEDAGKLKDQRSLDNIRGKYNIKRTVDGRVQLRRKNGNWMSVRLDMEVPGAILLRDTKTDAIFALETDGLPQVDLSDDYVLFMMFADGQWEKDMTAIEFEEDGGETKQLTMTEKEFHEFVGLLKEPDEPESKKK